MQYEQPQKITWANIVAKKQPNDGVGRMIAKNEASGEYPDAGWQQEFDPNKSAVKTKSGGGFGKFIKGLFSSKASDPYEQQLSGLGIQKQPKIAGILQALGNGIGQIQMGAQGNFKEADRYGAKQDALMMGNGYADKKLQIMKMMQSQNPAAVREFEYYNKLPDDQQGTYAKWMDMKKDPLKAALGEMFRNMSNGSSIGAPTAGPTPNQNPSTEPTPEEIAEFIKNLP